MRDFPAQKNPMLHDFCWFHFLVISVFERNAFACNRRGGSHSKQQIPIVLGLSRNADVRDPYRSPINKASFKAIIPAAVHYFVSTCRLSFSEHATFSGDARWKLRHFGGLVPIFPSIWNMWKLSRHKSTIKPPYSKDIQLALSGSLLLADLAMYEAIEKHRIMIKSNPLLLLPAGGPTYLWLPAKTSQCNCQYGNSSDDADDSNVVDLVHHQTTVILPMTTSRARQKQEASNIALVLLYSVTCVRTFAVLRRTSPINSGYRKGHNGLSHIVVTTMVGAVRLRRQRKS